MSWLDRALDGDEATIERARWSATFALAWAVILIVLAAGLFVASLVSEIVTGDDHDVPGTVFATAAILGVLALFAQERYRRRKLEERVRALEAKTS